MAPKSKITPKNKLTNFNWTPMPPKTVKGTVFCEFNNEEKLLKV